MRLRKRRRPYLRKESSNLNELTHHCTAPMTRDSYQPPSSKEHVRALSKRWLQCTFIRQQYLGVRIPGRNHACGVLFWVCARWQCNTHVSDRFSKHTLTKRRPGCRASAPQHNTGRGFILRRRPRSCCHPTQLDYFCW